MCRRRDKHINVRPIERVYLRGVILALTVISWPYGSRVWFSRNEKRRNGISIRWKMTSYPLLPACSPLPFIARSSTSHTYGRLPFLAWRFDPDAMSDRILQETRREMSSRWVVVFTAAVCLLLISRLIVTHVGRMAVPMTKFLI